MQQAVEHNVLIYCYDINVDPDRDDDGFYRDASLSPTEVVKLRNEHMSQKYLSTPNKSDPGTILLGGSDHFDKTFKTPNMLEITKTDQKCYIRCD